MIRRHETGLVVVGKNVNEWKTTIPLLRREQDHNNVFNSLIGNKRVEKKQIGHYWIYVLKREILILDDVNIDGNIYVINCEIKCERKVRVSTQIFTSNAVISQHLKCRIPPIQWHSKFHYEIPLQLQDLEDIQQQYSQDGSFTDAIIYLEKHLRLSRDAFGLIHPYVAIAYHRLAIAYENDEQYDQAIECNKWALKISLDTFELTHASIISLYNKIELAYHKQMKHEKINKLLHCKLEKIGIWTDAQTQNALENNEDSLNMQLNDFGVNLSGVAWAFDFRAAAYKSQDHFNKAIENYEKAMKIRLDIFGFAHADVITSYSNLGNAYFDKAYYEEAIEYHLKAVEIGRDVFQKQNYNVGASCWDLGLAFEKKGEKSRAYAFFEEAWNTFTAVLGEWNTHTLSAKKKLKKLRKHL
ncbi:hypothetical protein RFI_03601 [Reticulomyxa filosa]|uniref:Tetratricopeptide repeat protein n=1 Tax=Reticulomyxa filosa TaxID=46433 RepID=X6P4N9_RETFI|nr:hypothetical protein RFI_03601 [Reticulomyxa filosa]|eukprot:ETO33500.1 hypothetical protein RFI_03601 [Reticulomyxa filosa]